MPKVRSLKKIDREIAETEEKLVRAQKRYEMIAAELKELRKTREIVMAQTILAALKKSDKDLEDVMTFLGQ